MLCAHQWNFAVYLLSRPRLRSTNPLLFVFFRRDAAGIRKDEINVCQRTWPADGKQRPSRATELFGTAVYKDETIWTTFQVFGVLRRICCIIFERKIGGLNFDYIITEKMTKFICLFLSVVLMEANCASSVNSYLNPYRFNSYYPWPQWNYPSYFYNQPSARTPRTHYIKS